MKSLLSTLLFSLIGTFIYCQNPGDTIVVKTFNYSQTYGINQWSGGIRDTMIEFPTDPDISYEKVIMKYNMRCKDGNVSPPISGQTDIGCGEWDINCHTYITDSTRIDSILTTHPSHFISNFSDIVFSYNTIPHYNFYEFEQQDNDVTAINNEQPFYLTDGFDGLENVIAADQNSSKSLYFLSAEELQGSGLTAGDIDGLSLAAAAESNAQFLRIKVLATEADDLNPNTYDKDALTQVYFKNTAFVAGSNFLLFDDAFNWDGMSNLVVEFSFTNTVQSNLLSIEGSNSVGYPSLHAQNEFHINTAAAGVLDVNPDALEAVSDQITITFWSRGNEGVNTVNTSVLEATNDGGTRHVNIHLPWSNSRVYWDCGNDGGGYDRIDKAATVDELSGTWHHWAFVKNASTGNMYIYLDGELWHSGTGKTKSIDIQKFVLGANKNYGNIFRGDIDELSIWNKALDQSTIQSWVHRTLDNTHPDYSNLLAYYPLNEGSGEISSDHSPNGLVSSFANPAQWNYARGKDISRVFRLADSRPDFTLFRGDYTVNSNTVTLLDSLLIPPHLVNTYEIKSNYNTLLDDEAVVINSQYLWQAGEYFLFDGETGEVLDAFEIEEDDILGIEDLPFTRRYPSKIQIMSFVTPYGINLDLGENGKTWTFDVSDFGPILSGSKRMTVEAGGQWMEDMDIQFLFIVGTPPRDVIDFKNIWRVRSTGYTNILTNKVFPPVDFTLNPNASQYKIRSVISGHGQEGEFIPRNHYLNLDGAAEEFIWEVWMECADNPVYPQGGTWIYDRAGWCPGFPTLLSEYDITEFGEPGQNISIDYGMYQASGSSNYWVSNTMVSYGENNFQSDASIIDVVAPTSNVEHQRVNAVCANPIITIQNTGSETLESVKINYWINDGTVATYTWEGELEFLQKEEVALPSPSELWVSANSTDNTFYVEIEDPNGGANGYDLNNNYETDFDMPDDLTTDEIYIWFWTNKAAYESKYELFDSEGNSLFSRSGMSNQTDYKDTFDLSGGCYTLVISDTGDDGIDFWANNDGLGFCRIIEVEGEAIHYVEGDFGDSYIYSFSVDPTVGVKEGPVTKPGLKVFPNPANDIVHFEGIPLDRAPLIYDEFGKLIQVQARETDMGYQIITAGLASGIYYAELITEGQKIGKKFIIIN